MKPFDLEAAMRGEPVVTRDGRDFKFGAYNPNASVGAIVGWVDDVSCSWDKDGRCYVSQYAPRDLFMKPRTIEKWVIIGGWRDQPCPNSYFYESREYAEAVSYGKPVARVTWEE